MRACLALAVTLTVVVASASGATAPPRSFSGQCSFSGPIQPMAPITVVPRPGAAFSYRGRGTCSGTLGGVAVSAAPLTVRFDDVHTLFDTCELGPDLPLHGRAAIGSGRRRVAIAITVDMVRLALAGPFSLSSSLGGRAAGVAEFQPADATTAPTQCAAGGISTASLSASFSTLRPLVGRRSRG